MKFWIGFMWLTEGTSVFLLGLSDRRGPTQRRSARQEGMWPMELFVYAEHLH